MKALNVLMRSLVAGGIVSLPVFVLAAQADETTTPGFESAKQVAPQAAAFMAPANVFVPESSKEMPGDAGVRVHTNYVIHNPKGIRPGAMSDLRLAGPADKNGFGGEATFAEYPASLACLYKMGPTYAGCAPANDPAHNAVGGSRAIAIVIAYDYPTAKADLDYFTSFFGLPTANFTKVIANADGRCGTPAYNAGWAMEGSMDLQWAHAMAPSARIILVEACSNSYADMMYAVETAGQKLLAYGGGQVSNSWGSGEFATEVDLDVSFRKNWVAGKPISYIFSSGDSGLGAQYPSSSPWVISAGGTTINRDPATGAFQSESCWAGSGGGISAYETYSSTFGKGTGPWTNFQYPLFGQASRATPDVSAVADPNSGAWVRFEGGWYVIGGTSLSAPLMAGIINNSNNRLGVAPSPGGYYSNMENNLLYAQLATYKEYKTNFYDVTTGSNGAAAGAGWDYCTGVGTPRGKLGK
ncbi:S53 family peptidase [Ideonella sp. YS5]|uniref:S53 family peptidase n=1 Tax=Ideonella sp. YS5 TaxID=3453714 RepID=UPI003EEBBF3D